MDQNRRPVLLWMCVFCAQTEDLSKFFSQAPACPCRSPVHLQHCHRRAAEEPGQEVSHPFKNILSTFRFSFAETGFLWRWFTSNHDFDRHKLQKLVKTGNHTIETRES